MIVDSASLAVNKIIYASSKVIMECKLFVTKKWNYQNTQSA